MLVGREPRAVGEDGGDEGATVLLAEFGSAGSLTESWSTPGDSCTDAGEQAHHLVEVRTRRTRLRVRYTCTTRYTCN